MSIGKPMVGSPNWASNDINILQRELSKPYLTPEGMDILFKVNEHIQILEEQVERLSEDVQSQRELAREHRIVASRWKEKYLTEIRRESATKSQNTN